MASHPRSLLTVAILAICFSVGASDLPGAPETHRKPMETHHSCFPPFDQGSVYWKYGGNAVSTSKSLRLTPATQSMQGWFWNDYPLESPNWEVEAGIKVSSKPHFGGDGFAFWVLSSEMDPSFQTSDNSLNGPIFGMQENFKGLGVVFDTYDNDGRRDNPSVFAIKNNGEKFIYNNDNDYADNYIRDTPTNSHYKCTADYRNLGKPMKVLFRYVDKVLHVYIDDSVKERGYKFCFSVNVDLDYIPEKHLAFTSMTGEVADIVDLTYVSTHYLDERDASISDNYLEHSESIGGSKWRWTYWFVVLCSGVFLLGWTVRDIVQLSSFQKSHVNPVYICNELNSWILPHFIIHFCLCFLLVFGSWTALLLNAPLVIYRIMLIVQKNYALDPAILSGGSHKGHAKPKLSYTTRLYITAFLYLIPTCFYFFQLFYSLVICDYFRTINHTFISSEDFE